MAWGEIGWVRRAAASYKRPCAGNIKWDDGCTHVRLNRNERGRDCGSKWFFFFPFLFSFRKSRSKGLNENEEERRESKEGGCRDGGGRRRRIFVHIGGGSSLG